MDFMTSNLKTIIWNSKDFEVKKHAWLISVSYSPSPQKKVKQGRYIFFFQVRRIISLTALPKWAFDFPPCVLCDAENTEGAGLLLTEGLTKSIEGSFLNLSTEGRNREGGRKERKAEPALFIFKQKIWQELAWRIWKSLESHIGQWELHVLLLLYKTLLKGKRI